MSESEQQPGPEEQLGLDEAAFAEAGLHEEPDTPTDEAEDPQPEPFRNADVAPVEDLVVTFVELFNARDESGLTALLAAEADLPGLGRDREGFPDAVEELWDRNPTVTATPGWLEDEPVVVLWVWDDPGWWRTDAITIAGDADSIELAELLEEPRVEQADADEPEHDLAEGTGWREWEEGVLD